MKKLASLLLIAALTACSANSHCPHCATRAGHQECCGDKSGFCPHGRGGEHKPDAHKHAGHPHEAHKHPHPMPAPAKPCHGGHGQVKDWDVKHNAEWHNSH